MKQNTRKLCLFLMALCLIVGLLPLGAMAAETADTGVEFRYQQLTLADDLIMNFELAIEESIAQQAIVNLTVDGDITPYTVSQMTVNSRGNYSFSVEIAAAQMTEEINVAVTVGESIIAEKDYTVRAYVDALLAEDCSKEAEALVKEMLNYGAKAQSYFDYNSDNSAIAGYEGDITPAAVPSETPEISVEGDVSGISYYGSSMLFTGKLAVRYYFTAPNGVEGYTFTANGNSYEADTKDGLYYVDVAGINPQNIDESVVLTVSDESSSLSIGYGPMHYITRMYNGKGSENLKNLLQAMYGYHLAAKNYVVAGSLSVSEAIELVGTDTSAYIDGYVAGYSVDGTTRKAIILQDTVTGECIEFWGSDSSAYNDVWNTYEVGDHVVICAESIVDNKGLPRANATVKPVAVDGSYKLSAGNEIQVTEIIDMDAFLNSVYSDGANTLGVYTCTATVADSNYFHEIILEDGKLRIQLYQSAATPTLEVGNTYNIQFVLTGYNKALSNTGNLYVRVSVMDENDVVAVKEAAEYTVNINGETNLYVGDAKPDFTNYFTIVDSVDGEIAITSDMITENVDMSTPGTYEVVLYCENSEGKFIEETLEINVIYNVGVSEAIELLGENTPAYINGYVAGYITNTSGNHTAVILQDTVTGECIEFWANDHSDYRDIWNTYTLGDHVKIYTDKIVSNKGLPRAGSAKNGTYPVEVISTGNKIQVVEITDMEAFLQDAIANGTNILGKYSYTGTVTNEDGYLYTADKGDGYKLNLDLYNSPVSATFENGKKYGVTFVVLAYSKALSSEEDITLRIAILEEGDVEEIVEIPEDADYTVSISGERKLLAGTAKPDFTTYFTIVDSVDGEIAVTNEMLIDNVDMSTAGTYEVVLSCVNSKGQTITATAEIEIFDSLSVSEAIELLGTNTPAYINGYVAGYSVDGTRKAIILQDTENGECIEFWGSDSNAYNDVWSSYEVGDHVTIYADSIVDNKGLPRANKTVTPIEINGSYIMSSGNEIQVTEITDMDAFMNAIYSDGANTLGVYSCTVTVANSNYFYEIATSGGKLRIQLYQSAATPTLEVGSTYHIQFVLTGYNKALNNTGNLYVRVTVMDANDVAEVAE